jgi:hypothetical protein
MLLLFLWRCSTSLTTVRVALLKSFSGTDGKSHSMSTYQPTKLAGHPNCQDDIQNRMETTYCQLQMYHKLTALYIRDRSLAALTLLTP